MNTKIYDYDEYYNQLDDYSKNQWDQLHAALSDFEGQSYNFPYLDTAGLITDCKARNVDDKDTFYAQPYFNINTNQPATLAEKILYRNDLKKSFADGVHVASWYKKLTPLRLPAGYCDNAYKTDIAKFYNQLQGSIPNYGKMPLPTQLSMLETHYNTGSLNNEKRWPRLYNFSRAMNQGEICKNIHRKPYDDNNNLISNMPKRNDWAYRKCMEVPFN